MSVKISFSYNFNKACRVLLSEKLSGLNIAHHVKGSGEVEIHDTLDDSSQGELLRTLRLCGMEIVDNHKNSLIRKTQALIIALVHEEDRIPNAKIASRLAAQLNHSVGYLSKLFSEQSHMSIEQFIILHKIERVKKMLCEGELSLTDISYQLNYSSVAHLSNQFKKATGMNPTTFQRILRKRIEKPLLESEEIIKP